MFKACVEVSVLARLTNFGVGLYHERGKKKSEHGILGDWHRVKCKGPMASRLAM